MALNNIVFNRGQGGLGRPLPGEDHISGIVFYLANANLPSGFLTTDRIKKVFSIEEAEALGIAEGSAFHATLWYHINEFFRRQPQGELFIGIFDSLSIDYSKIEDVQNFADGKIRQIGVYDRTAFATANVTTLQTSATALQAADKPLSVIYAADISGTSDLTTLGDLRALTAPNVSVTIGEDGANVGAALAVTETVSLTDLGALLGAVSLAQVHQSIAFVSKFDITQGASEFDVPGFANGDLFKDTSSTVVAGLDTKGYIFLRKFVGLAGTFHNDSHTDIAVTSDFAFIENQRTIDKAVRGIRTNLLPSLNGPIEVNADGTLTEEFIANFQNNADIALELMLRDGELSAFETKIDPSQDVLTTSKIEITVTLVPVGVAREIEVNIGFAVSIS